jgi:hypothetical protein
MIKIYKLIYDNEIVYVGQTKQELTKRKKSGYGNTVPFFKECSVELIEETTDVSREKYWIEKLRSEGHPLLNKICGVTGLDKKEYDKEYRDCNREKKKEHDKEYYQKNKEVINQKKKEYNKEYSEKNKEKRKEYQKEYRDKKKLEKNNLMTP